MVLHTHMNGISSGHAPCRCAFQTLFKVCDVKGGAVLLKRTLSEQELEGQDTQTPEIASLSMHIAADAEKV